MVYFEAAAVITALVLLGQVLELRARSRTGSAIKALLNLAPPTARQVTEGGDNEVPLDQVRVGDWLRVVPGDKVPTDGEVVEGYSSVEESMALNRIRAGAIIISASGMCNAGRIKHHLRHNLGRRECSVLITGFQAAGKALRRLTGASEPRFPDDWRAWWRANGAGG